MVTVQIGSVDFKESASATPLLNEYFINYDNKIANK
jgi:hypothetical protein